jgi:hypothetical protein
MSQLVAQHTKNCQKTLICRWCIFHFTHQQEIHDKHVKMCKGLKKTSQADRMPSDMLGGNIYEFNNWNRRMHPYYFVADFKALVMDIAPKEENKEKKTKKDQKQVPCSYSYVKVRYDGVSEPQRIFTGKDAAQNFVIEIVKEATLIRKEFNNPMEMIPLTSQKQATHNNATNCWIC